MPTLANAAAKLKCRARSCGGVDLPALWLMTDESRLADPLAAVARLPRGSGVVLRHYGDKQRHVLAARLAPVCRRRGLTLVVAADWRLAARVGAAGIHLPEYLARLGLSAGARLWRSAKKTRLLTVAAHGFEGLHRAENVDASAAFLAPAFVTDSHLGRSGLGPRRFGQLVRAARLRVIALGGVNARSVAQMATSRCAGVAGIGFAAK
ncbi:MAG: thiamine phosphate synthase [Rhodospirillaceae bacterium]|nr:thiamine phosphate synthase [Rhodospirillaceae bacterium]